MSSLPHLRTSLKCSAAAFGALLLAQTPATANPLGGTVTTGAASIASTSNATTVHQTSEGVVIDWSSFDVGKGQTTTFAQPNAQAIAVNRIGGNNASQIMGTLDANGRIVLINGNGLLFGKGSQVNVGALVATSSDASDGDLLSGKAKFSKSGNPNATIVSDGRITASQGGLVALVAPNVSNSGTINAKLGTVSLGGADKFTLDFTGDGLVSFAAQASSQGHVANTGKLNGATVSLTARSAEGLAAGVLNAGGTITASAAHAEGGSIVLDGGVGGNIDISGHLDASGANGGGSIATGGSLASNVTVEKTALLSADATRSGNGGSIKLVSSNDTQFDGVISAKGAGANGIGGSADVSGHGTLGFTGLADLTSASGKAGTLTLDPTDYFITADGTSPEPGASSISATTLEAELASAKVTLKTKTSGHQDGDITIATDLNWSSPYTLTLKAYRNIVVDTGVTIANTGGGGVTLNADSTGDGTGSVTFSGTAALNVSGGGSATIFYDPADYDHPIDYSSAVTVTGGGTNTAYMLVNNVTQLQAIGADSTTLTGDYALSQNIDASATATWNSGAGFAPIGDSTTPFTGILNGQNHSIDDLTIYAPTNGYVSVGLFANAGGTIMNIGLTGGSITGDDVVGSLVGDESGIVSGAFTTADVFGTFNVGGLVGQLEVTGTIKSSTSAATIAPSPASPNLLAAGGELLAMNYGTVVNSHTSTSITFAPGSDTQAIGDLVGDNNKTGVIKRSYATGDATGGFAAIGGLVGSNEVGAIIANSYATGSVTGDEYLGGLVGEDNGNISKSYSAGNVTGVAPIVSGGSYAGPVGGFVGLVGTTANITNTYETGDVSITGAGPYGDEVGGFAGRIIGSSIEGAPKVHIEWCYASGSGGVYGFADIVPDTTTVFRGDYWDTTTNTNPGDSLPGPSEQINGLTTPQFQSGLPSGFSATVWGSDPSINDEFPYLLANPPT